MPQLKYMSNFQRFQKAVDLMSTSHVKRATLSDLFEQFEEPSCLSMKVVYSLGGEKIRVDYGLSLSCFHFINESARLARHRDSGSNKKEEVKLRDQGTTVSQKKSSKT